MRHLCSLALLMMPLLVIALCAWCAIEAAEHFHRAKNGFRPDTQFNRDKELLHGRKHWKR